MSLFTVIADIISHSDTLSCHTKPTCLYPNLDVGQRKRRDIMSRQCNNIPAYLVTLHQPVCMPDIQHTQVSEGTVRQTKEEDLGRKHQGMYMSGLPHLPRGLWRTESKWTKLVIKLSAVPNDLPG